ncbi:MAG TPA: SusC/RagA family TonB-linked outer membrane protein, partial [Lentimicrobium sp.]|nr:SusC/RagA family TonB-linked outer membrane protein [Lentimicrobium sp.]
NGRFSLKVPADAKTLQVSFVGMKSKDVPIGKESTINVILETEVMDIEGVVVTALGISREKKALGYAVEEVKAEELNQTRSGNLITSLSGKVSGVSITNASGNMGGSSRITIRGIKSVAGNNQPLFVVDGVPMDNSNYNDIDTQRGAGGVDYGNMANDINPDDIESVSVLKGPTAAALYGSRAANGVILITTKKAKAGKKGIGVEVNSSVSFEQVSLLPKYQNSYGGGYVYTGEGTDAGFALQDINGTNYRLIDYALDESWGPKYDPNIQVLSAFDIFDWEANGKQGNPKTSSWVAPSKDVKDFFETGVVFNNNFAVTGSNESSAFRLSYTNYNLSGYMPNSEQKRNAVNFNGESQISKILKGFIGANYVNTYTLGRPETGYDDNNIMQKFNQWGQRQLDMGVMSNYVNPDGTQRVWNRSSWDDPTPAYSDNPYWTRYRNYQDDQKNRLFGNVGLILTPMAGLSIQGKWNLDYYNLREMERNAVGSQAESSYTENTREVNETNAELIATYKFNPTDKFSLNFMAGTNRRHRIYSRNTSNTNGGLIIPNLYKITNSTNKPTVAEYEDVKEVQSVFGSVNAGYMGMLYLDLTYRADWTSTLTDASYTYPSATVSFVFSELDALKNNDFLSFGKVRMGVAESGNDTDPYNNDYYYTYVSNFGGLAMYSIPGTLNNKDLLPETTKSFEVGTELMFLKNRIGLDFTYYNEATYDQIIPVAISGASGYGFRYINSGKITNKGIEVQLNVTPIKTKDFTWNINGNFTKNTNEVVELAQDLDVYQLTNGPFSVSVNAEVKLPYGSLIGTSYITDDKGNIIVDTDGYTLTGPVKSIGTVLPDWMLGVWNKFNYKGLELSCLIDVREGGQFFSTTSMWGRYSGILAETAETNDNGMNVRDAVEDGGGALFEGVYGYQKEDGSIQYTDADGNDVTEPVKNTTHIDAESWGGWHYAGPAEANVFNADYIKLRELRLSYTLPGKWTGPIQNLAVSAFGRNLAIWGTDIEHVDPENTTGSGNIQGIEGGALPSLRYFGLGLNFNF